MTSVGTPEVHSGGQETLSNLDLQIIESTTGNIQNSNISLQDVESEAHIPLEYPCNFCYALGTVSRDRWFDWLFEGVNFSYQPDLPEKLYLDIFHGECDKCSSDGSQASLCSFCAHLRPWHLFNHVLPESESSLGDEQIPFLSLGDLMEIRNRAPDCDFCDFLAKRPQFSHLFAWTRIGIVLWESRRRLFADSVYVGDLFLDAQRILTVSACPGIQWDLIKGWLKDHPNQLSRGEPSPGQVFDCFRLIDVAKECVVQISEPTKYATLSYVWGKAADAKFEATSHTISALEREGGLASVKIPATIQDAIVATKRLGLEYLWVDRICIVQDDDNSKLPQIYRMDIIFASSYVTLVAQGQDAMCGLPGVRLDRQGLIQTAHWDGMTIGFPYWPHKPDTCDEWFHHGTPERSDWHKRGWTYQEAVVSKRLLYFTHEGVFLENKEKNTILVEGGTHGPHPPWQTHSYPSYEHAVREISRRKFTYSSDILPAFQGILNWILEKKHRIETDHRFGIPFAKFDLAIQWYSKDTVSKRSSDKRQIFPSWSWASVEGRIDYPQGSVRPLGSLATWAFCGQSGSNQAYLVPVLSHPVELSIHWSRKGGEAQGSMMIAWNEGCFPKAPPSDLKLDLHNPALDLQKSAVQMISHFTYDDFWQASRGEQWQQNMFSPDDLRITSMHPGRLMVHTQCALLDIEPDKSMRKTSDDTYIEHDKAEKTSDFRDFFYIKSHGGKKMGGIKLNPEPQKMLSSFYMQTRGMRVEFLALTVNEGREGTMPWVNYFDLEREEVSYPWDPMPLYPIVKVMLVHRCGRVARRLGIGFVFLKLWVKVERKLRTVILE